MDSVNAIVNMQAVEIERLHKLLEERLLNTNKENKMPTDKDSVAQPITAAEKRILESAHKQDARRKAQRIATPTDREIAIAATLGGTQWWCDGAFFRHFDPWRVLALLDVVEAANDLYRDYGDDPLGVLFDRLEALDRNNEC